MSKADELRAKIGLAGPPPQPIPREPPHIPDHELIRCVGQGSYGEVWLARNVVGSYRAVKVVYRDTFKDERPFEREFEGIQKFEPISRSCEGLVHVLQIGRSEEAGYFYYVMELADDVGAESENVGERESGKARRTVDTGTRSTAARIPNLKSQISNPDAYVPKTLSKVRHQHGRLPAAECVQLGLSLTKALAHLHAQGLLHRDIKPSNIIFVNGAPKLADIGLVTETSEASSFVGTEGFIPPEGPNSPQADIYSLGKVLYEIAMGRDRQEFPEPFTGLWEDAQAEALLELNAVILKACATDRRERYESADEMHADLALLQRGKSVRRLHSLRHRLGILAKVGAAAAAVALVAFGANLWLEYRMKQLQQRPTVGSGRLAGKIPARDPRAILNQLDLAAHYNVLLDEHWFGPEGNDLASLPRGLQKLGDVEFDVRGLVQLASPEIRSGPVGEFPQGISGLGVGLKCARLHFLHGTIAGAGEGQEIGRYVVRYASGARHVVPIRYGVEVRDCWDWSGAPQETTNAAVAWRGQNTATRERGFALQLYLTTWPNPLPDVRIADVDFVSGGSRSAPFLLAITAEPHVAPEETVEPSLLDRIQSDAPRYQRVRTSQSFGQPDFQTVRLNTERRRAGSVFYDAIRFATPPEPGWDLVWLSTFSGIASCDGWQMTPVEGTLRVGFEDWYHGPRAQFKNLPDEGRKDLALQYLDGKKLQASADYLIWFTFADDKPADLRLAITFVPAGRASAGRLESLEAALGLERVPAAFSTNGMTVRTNCAPGLHRHFCLGASHW
ncbi:MAG: serine/threonine protein kinase [Verrucomicrobia bacterium]|nr:serine/threonine protein kinase [Verrucomicrobiota bacterium]